MEMVGDEENIWFQNYSKLPSRVWTVLMSLYKSSEMLGVVLAVYIGEKKDYFKLEFDPITCRRCQRDRKELQTENWSCHRQE